MHTTAVCFCTLAIFPGLGENNKGKDLATSVHALGRLSGTWKNHQAWDLAISAHAHGRLPGQGLGRHQRYMHATAFPGTWEKTTGQGTRGTAARTRSVGDLAIFFLSGLGKNNSRTTGDPVASGLFRAKDGEDRGMGGTGGGGDESKRQRAESQRIVAARPLCAYNTPSAYLSRLQRILPAARWELYFKAADAARPPRRLGQRHVPLGARGPLLRVGKRTAGVRVASSPDSDLEAFSQIQRTVASRHWLFNQAR
ncbi:UNVERIFIED_CONTAM: hypothetical protein Scaly_2118600 [Sesamum calycinum]|uniref:Uncharacterized protein n=1 Tax=Sesamum calycinum TaxID=2727403 RepID=A0AAW2MQ17_9LAMI